MGAIEIAGKLYSGLIFDFDGVLADSVEVKTEAFGALFMEYGPKIQTKVIDHHRAHGGMTRKEKFVHYHAHFLDDPLDETGLERLCRKFSGLVMEKVIASREIPGVGRFLERCRTLGVPCFVDSATPDEELEIILERRNLRSYFTAALGSGGSKTENLARIIDSHGLNHRECLFFGDAGSDYKAATACRVDFMGILPGPAAPLLAQHPDIHWAEDFNQLEGGTIHGR
tara:strand:- start:826 stop:1506 length:681 start_codon:yes stop_codon:yes gene_type:complete